MFQSQSVGIKNRDSHLFSGTGPGWVESAEPGGGSGATQEESREQLLGTDCLF